MDPKAHSDFLDAIAQVLKAQTEGPGRWYVTVAGQEAEVSVSRRTDDIEIVATSLDGEETLAQVTVA